MSDREPSGAEPCRWTRLHLSELAARELAPAQFARAQAHLLECPSCRREAEEVRRVEGLFPLDGDVASSALAELHPRFRDSSAVTGEVSGAPHLEALCRQRSPSSMRPT